MNRPLLASLALLLPVLGCEPEPYCLNCATGDGGLINVRDVAPIRANGPAYDRPIVEAWDRLRLKDAPAVVDLTDESSPRVVKPLAFLR